MAFLRDRKTEWFRASEIGAWVGPKRSSNRQYETKAKWAIKALDGLVAAGYVECDGRLTSCSDWRRYRFVKCPKRHDDPET